MFQICSDNFRAGARAILLRLCFKVTKGGLAELADDVSILLAADSVDKVNY